MKIAIIYDSNTGNTKELALAIKDALKGYEVVYCDKPGDVIPKADIYFIGSWTDKGDTSNKIKAVLKDLHDQKIAYFATAGFNDDGYYKRLFLRAKINIPDDNEILGHFYCQGKMPMAVRERYEALIKANPDDQKLMVSISNFDEALSHPNHDDIDNVKKWALEMVE